MMGSCCIAADPKQRPLLWSRLTSGKVMSISLPSGISTGSPRQEFAYPHADGSMCSLPRLSCGHMMGRRSGRCGHYSSSYTPTIPTRLPALSLLQRPYMYPGLSNARWQSAFHRRAGPASALPVSLPRWKPQLSQPIALRTRTDHFDAALSVKRLPLPPRIHIICETDRQQSV
jgi:hypothetical protein